MGKLNIAHHKSYHPYRRDNIEKVKRDEEEAALKEAREEGRVLLADSEARIDLLRSRNGLGASGKKKGKDKEVIEDILSTSAGPTSLLGQRGHINLFEDLEQGQSSFSRSLHNKKKEPEETEKGVPLAPSAKDLKPWYVAGPSSPEREPKERDDEPWEEKRKRDRDAAFKALNDPLTSITHQLASRSGATVSQTHLPPRPSRGQPPRPRPPRHAEDADIAGPPRPPPQPIDARLLRESSERERALALIARKKREMEGSETPSTVHGGFGGYGDVYNRDEVEAAHRGQRGWDGRRNSGRSRDSRRW
ncbi:hypothetical protein HWV62_41042 [Athelia sp. TMB]|nr:hypothetical protein HWV62_41042 [Athelia sp. TMB]